MRNLKIALAALATSVLATAAHAGAWPEAGDQFRRDDGTLLVVAKIKTRPDVSESLVCLRKRGGRAQNTSCAWAKVGDLHGDWITYGGVPQTAQAEPGGETDVKALSCSQLWHERNSIFKAAGYCFRTQRAIATFGNAGCVHDNIRDVPLSDRDRQLINAINTAERMKRCPQ